MGLGQSAHLIRRHVAGDHQNGIVRGVVAVIKAVGVGQVQPLDLVAPADHRHAVRVVHVECRIHLLGEQALGAVIGALVALLQNDVSFGRDHFICQRQIAHPVRFHAHHQPQPIGGDALEICGVVLRGEGVVRPAIRGDDLRECAVGDLAGGLEHQMLEKVGDAGMAPGFIGRPDPVPDHMGHDRGAVVLDDNYFHAIVQPEIAHGRFGPGLRRQSHWRRNHGHEQAQYHHGSG
jgi:hypothetical protein